MLVLSRKKQERVKISGPCDLTVIDIRGDKVRLGFEAPKSTSVLRAELVDQLAAPESQAEKAA